MKSVTEVTKMRNDSNSKEEAYLDRNLVVQALAKLAMDQGLNVGIKQDKEWPILYIDFPTGQVSWHIPAAELVRALPEYNGKWDGHDLEEKRKRIKEFLEAEK